MNPKQLHCEVRHWEIDCHGGGVDGPTVAGMMYGLVLSVILVPLAWAAVAWRSRRARRRAARRSGRL